MCAARLASRRADQTQARTLTSAAAHSASYQASSAPCISGQPHQRLADADPGPLAHPLVQREAARREDEDRRAVLEPAHLLALGETRLARNDIGAAIAKMQEH